MTLSIEDLQWKIYNVFPAGELALDHLLGLLSIKYSTLIPTAAVKNEMPPSLLFNPEFIEKHCKTDEHLLMILMHEMYHVILGHTRLFQVNTLARNFAFDAIINSMICQSMPGYEYVSFFTSIYNDDGIEALLRPPELWSPENESRARWKLEGDLLEIHKALYTQEGDLTYRDVFDQVSKRLNEDTTVLLLGSHDKDKMEDSLIDPDTVKAIVKVVGQWPAFEQMQGRDQGKDIAEHLLELTRPVKSISQIIRKAIAKIARHGQGVQHVYQLAQRETLLPYPTLPDRRVAVMQSLGQTPVFFRGSALNLCRETVGNVHIYLDVSGSMNLYLDTIFSCLKPIQNWVHPKVHIFSTEVIDYPIQNILQGRYKSTYGTDINCVLEHIIENKINKAAIITDGYVGKPSEMLIDNLPQQFNLVKLLTPNFYTNDIRLLPGAIHQLPIKEE